jgi:hypothetical protein
MRAIPLFSLSFSSDRLVLNFNSLLAQVCNPPLAQVCNLYPEIYTIPFLPALFGMLTLRYSERQINVIRRINIEIKKEVVLKINSEVCVSTKLPYFIIPLLAQVCNLCPEII